MSSNKHQLNIRISRHLRQKIRERAKENKYPSPYDENEWLYFCSETEYIEYLLKSAVKMSPDEWESYCNLFNPNRPY